VCVLLGVCLSVACSSSNSNSDGGTGGSGGRRVDGGGGVDGGDAAGTAGSGGSVGTGGTVAPDGGLDRTDTAGGDSADAPAAMLNDGQVAGVMLEANAGEVQAGNVANARSMNPAVRMFAAMMITDHAGANQTLEATLAAQAIEAADSPLRRMLSDQAAQTLNSLWAASPSGFDVAYADSQVAMHMMVLGLLDQTLIPMASNAALKMDLQAARMTVSMHLMAAQQLRLKLSSDGGAPDSVGGTDATDAGADAGDAPNAPTDGAGDSG
jgi:putative membrane protein